MMNRVVERGSMIEKIIFALFVGGIAALTSIAIIGIILLIGETI